MVVPGKRDWIRFFCSLTEGPAFGILPPADLMVSVQPIYFSAGIQWEIDLIPPTLWQDPRICQSFRFLLYSFCGPLKQQNPQYDKFLSSCKLTLSLVFWIIIIFIIILLLYIHIINMQLYIYTCWIHNDAMNNDERHSSFRKIYLSLYCKVCV